jgi:hypothetical protein
MMGRTRDGEQEGEARTYSEYNAIKYSQHKLLS